MVALVITTVHLCGWRRRRVAQTWRLPVPHPGSVPELGSCAFSGAPGIYRRGFLLWRLSTPRRRGRPHRWPPNHSLGYRSGSPLDMPSPPPVPRPGCSSRILLTTLAPLATPTAQAAGQAGLHDDALLLHLPHYLAPARDRPTILTKRPISSPYPTHRHPTLAAVRSRDLPPIALGGPGVSLTAAHRLTHLQLKRALARPCPPEPSLSFRGELSGARPLSPTVQSYGFTCRVPSLCVEEGHTIELSYCSESV